MQTLFSPLQVGSMSLATRIVMAPLTRNRASPGQVPNALMQQYYTQRANPATGAGLIITKATQISAMGQGYLDTPSNGADADRAPQALMAHVLAQLAPPGLAYVHVIEGQTGGARDVSGAPPFDYTLMRGQFKGVCMVNNGYTDYPAMLTRP
jgi:hypothetical protein